MWNNLLVYQVCVYRGNKYKSWQNTKIVKRKKNLTNRNIEHSVLIRPSLFFGAIYIYLFLSSSPTHLTLSYQNFLFLQISPAVLNLWQTLVVPGHTFQFTSKRFFFRRILFFSGVVTSTILVITVLD